MTDQDARDAAETQHERRIRNLEARVTELERRWNRSVPSPPSGCAGPGIQAPYTWSMLYRDGEGFYDGEAGDTE